jgi:hypothetical protein
MITFLWTSKCLLSIRSLAPYFQRLLLLVRPIAIKVEPVGRSKGIGEAARLPNGRGITRGGQGDILTTLDCIAVIEELSVCID